MLHVSFCNYFLQLRRLQFGSDESEPRNQPIEKCSLMINVPGRGGKCAGFAAELWELLSAAVSKSLTA